MLLGSGLDHTYVTGTVLNQLVCVYTQKPTTYNTGPWQALLHGDRCYIALIAQPP